jgi:hypothetical protein
METYLGRMFNHGAVMTNVFSWGIGGEALRNNFFRVATENPEALQAYAKFLRGEPLVESAATGFSSEAFQAKMRRIQAELTGWLQKSGKQAQAMPLIQKVQSLINQKKWLEADNVADQLLALIEGKQPGDAKTPHSTTGPRASSGPEDFEAKTRARLTGKVERIKQGVQAWAASGRDPSAILKAMSETFRPLMDQGKVADAEAELDRLLEMFAPGAERSGR